MISVIQLIRKNAFWLCWIFVAFGLRRLHAQDPTCDYFQDVEPAQTYYVFSKNYPGNYTAGISCRWQAKSPPGTVCRLNCAEVDIPVTDQCNGDKLLVSVTGDPQLTGADKYCGKGTLDISSTSNLLSIGFVSTATSRGGRFLCTLIAQNSSSTVLTTDCDCGWKKKVRIVGGTETQINEFPMMVALVDIQLKLVYCGATIISPRYIVTAAHCLTLQPQISNVGILYGEHNIRLGSETNATKFIRVEQFIQHPQYADGYDFDIGMMKTAEDIIFSDRVGPACLPFQHTPDSFANLPVEALGWGTQSFGGNDSDYLQKVTLSVVEQPACKGILGNVVTPRTLCTYSPNKDACQHDSGGPILYLDPNNGREYLAGVIIGGYGCASNKPGLNSRITEYIDWITANTPDAAYCNK